MKFPLEVGTVYTFKENLYYVHKIEVWERAIGVVCRSKGMSYNSLRYELYLTNKTVELNGIAIDEDLTRLMQALLQSEE